MRYCRTGFPHSDISGSKLICSSPKLFAAYHVLHRLLMPRHSPCALLCLTFVEAYFVSFAAEQAHRLIHSAASPLDFEPAFAGLQNRKVKNVSLLLPSHNLHQMSQCSVFKVHLELALIEIFLSEYFNQHISFRKMVGQSGLEPPTSRLSVVCSSQLSYWPIFIAGFRRALYKKRTYPLN